MLASSPSVSADLAAVVYDPPVRGVPSVRLVGEVLRPDGRAGPEFLWVDGLNGASPVVAPLPDGWRLRGDMGPAQIYFDRHHAECLEVMAAVVDHYPGQSWPQAMVVRAVERMRASGCSAQSAVFLSVEWAQVLGQISDAAGPPQLRAL